MAGAGRRGRDPASDASRCSSSNCAPTIPRLTPISDGVTAQVRQQYEENPYPRWVRMGAPPTPLRVLDDYIRQLFPTASFRPVGR